MPAECRCGQRHCKRATSRLQQKPGTAKRGKASTGPTAGEEGTAQSRAAGEGRLQGWMQGWGGCRSGVAWWVAWAGGDGRRAELCMPRRGDVSGVRG